MNQQRLEGLEFRNKLGELFTLDEETALRLAIKAFLKERAHIRDYWRYQSIAANIIKRFNCL